MAYAPQKSRVKAHSGKEKNKNTKKKKKTICGLTVSLAPTYHRRNVFTGWIDTCNSVLTWGPILLRGNVVNTLDPQIRITHANKRMSSNLTILMSPSTPRPKQKTDVIDVAQWPMCLLHDRGCRGLIRLRNPWRRLPHARCDLGAHATVEDGFVRRFIFAFQPGICLSQFLNSCLRNVNTRVT